MDSPPTIVIAPEPPPFPAPPRSVDLSPLEFILALIAVIAIPALIYTFFFSVKCPPPPFRRRYRSSNTSNFSDTLSVAESNELNTTGDQKEHVKYQKETHGKDIGSECPVCLSVFSDGEEVKQLSVCKHSFHAACIQMWLNSNSNCPVCRASVAPAPAPVKHPNSSNNNNRPTSVSSTSRRNNVDDLQQGLPDAASLV
ncbi:unnamed protein product [Dovyalis caffra]|uniref:RING-type domain-containing protein n=1 Tax=Dovyalis caffra TaxID=77055 RepID=A0AAV1RKS9_9ROSI|nr:unnamed protein product [Dovyalis caffra]